MAIIRRGGKIKNAGMLHFTELRFIALTDTVVLFCFLFLQVEVLWQACVVITQKLHFKNMIHSPFLSVYSLS